MSAQVGLAQESHPQRWCRARPSLLSTSRTRGVSSGSMSPIVPGDQATTSPTPVAALASSTPERTRNLYPPCCSTSLSPAPDLAAGPDDSRSLHTRPGQRSFHVDSPVATSSLYSRQSVDWLRCAQITAPAESAAATIGNPSSSRRGGPLETLLEAMATRPRR
jgi:hypothetical protein